MLPRRKVAALAVALVATMLFPASGCALLPPWHLFGTPVTRAESAAKKEDETKSKVGEVLQEEIHKTDRALDFAIEGNPHALKVAKQHSLTARTLADQIYGPATVLNEAKWAELIAKQTSLDEKVRLEGEKQAASRLEQIAKLSTTLDLQTAKTDAAEKKALQYANELQSFKDSVLKVAYVIGGLFLLYFAGQILALLAHFSPAFETASNAVNAIISPALHSAASRARKALAAAQA